MIHKFYRINEYFDESKHPPTYLRFNSIQLRTNFIFSSVTYELLSNQKCAKKIYRKFKIISEDENTVRIIRT